MTQTKFDESGMAATLDRQRAAHLDAGPPDLAQRKDRLARLRAVTLAHRDELVHAISQDFGHRSRHETDLLELMVVIQAIDYYRHKLHRFMRPERRHVEPLYQGGKAWVAYQPKGVIGIMGPWNYPISLLLIPLATAIAAGNRAMLKPSELTPRTSAVLQKMLAKVFGEDEIAVILGGPEVGAAFSRLPFDHLFFTGSTSVGRKVMAAASANLVPLTLELGGKSPAVVARGQVNARTLNALVFGKLSNAGQTCVAPDYALVHEDDLDHFVADYAATVQRSYPSGPNSNDYTAIISDHHFARLNGLLEDARVGGVKVIQVGVDPGSAMARPRTLAPALVIQPADDSAVMRDEIFGPILPIRTYTTMDEVIGYLNARPQPLALYYFGERDADCEKLLQHTSSGNVGINNTLLHVAQDDLPFGGIGQSGMGAYHGIEGFRAMSHAKGIFAQSRWNLAGMARAPFGKLADLAIWFNLLRKR
ncbi:coniferyl aldehyde dehydrogenase [Paracoccus caeni]|uniref:Aldehyde dehydrogenase n=1 Tax=Paracoccus caeni TaxID=657651 RepID=A0A934SB80_9RHOB|nr:coniferyl aldehyde dehydrogenase [Paracoccus caeni]MBK4215601.1 coniferyl aldehyde dehydrogenase [Paracoccus caeni]